MTIQDPELYYAWIDTHSELPQRILRLEAFCPRQVLGSGIRVHDAESGICLAIVYPNPDLEHQQEIAAFWERVRDATPR